MLKVLQKYRAVPLFIGLFFLISLLTERREEENHANSIRTLEKQIVKNFKTLKSKTDQFLYNFDGELKDSSPKSGPMGVRSKYSESRSNNYSMKATSTKPSDKIGHSPSGSSTATKKVNPKFSGLLHRRTMGESSAAQIKDDRFQEKLERLRDGEMMAVEHVVSPAVNAINIAMVVVNTKPTQNFDEEFANKTTYSLTQMLAHTNIKSPKPIHFILVTDELSSRQTGQLVARVIMKQLSIRVIQNFSKQKIGFPPVFFSLVDYKAIKAKKPEFVEEYRKLNETDEKGRYDFDFFFIAPLYHLAFTSLDRLIVLDCHDLEFRVDLAELDDQFYHFKSTEIMGIGVDLSPHYRDQLEIYRQVNPDTHIGEPGRFQGFNSGVVLYNFVRMRASKIYNSYLEPDNMKDLLSRYIYRSLLAEQDWMTNLGFSYPELFYVLPCTYNAQTTLEYMKEGMKEMFDDYHFCDNFVDLKIVHYNGCGSEPINCGHPGDPMKHVSKKYLDHVYIPPPIELNWRYLYEMNPPVNQDLSRNYLYEVIPPVNNSRSVKY